MRPGYKLPPLMLTDDEAVAVTLGLIAAERLGLDTRTPAIPVALAAASRSRRRVGIDYRSWWGDGSHRDLDPNGLVFHAGRWYVAGHDHRN